MKLQEQDALLAASVNPIDIPQPNLLRDIWGFIRKTLVITELEVRKLRHDSTELVTRAIALGWQRKWQS